MLTPLSLYQLGSKEQQLLLGLLVKNDSSFTDASIIDSQGMEVVKVSDRKVYFPSDLSDQSKSRKVYQSTQGGGLYKPGLHFRPGPSRTSRWRFRFGARRRVSSAWFRPKPISSFLWEAIGKIRFGTAGYAYLIDANGNLIAHKDAALVLKRMDLRQVDGVKKFLRNPTRSDLTPAQEGRGTDG